MAQEPLIDCPPSSGSDDELHQPAVVIDMPEVEKYLNRRKTLRVLKSAGLIAVFALLLTLISLELIALYGDFDGAPSDDSGPITLTVNVAPPQATVKLDGIPLTGDPPRIELEATDSFHSIAVAATGYESLTRDVRLQDSQTIKVKLRRLDRGTADDRASEEGNTADEDEIVFEFEDDSGRTAESASLVRKARPTAPATPRPVAGASAAPHGKQSDTSKDDGTQTPVVADPPRHLAQPAPQPPASGSPPSPARPQIGLSEKATPSPSLQVEENPYEPDVPGGTLVISVPAETSGPVEVFIDKKKHGIAPLTVELSRGLHEVVFISGGKRAFKMVNIRSGERRQMEAAVD